MKNSLLTITMTTESPAPESEADFNKLFCDEVGGETETRHEYSYGTGNTGYVVVDCETPKIKRGTITWFWIGSHSGYDNLLKQMKGV